MSIGFFIYFLLAVGSVFLAVLYLEFSALQMLLIVASLPICMGAVILILRKRITVTVESKYPVYEMKGLRKPAKIIIKTRVKNTSRLLPLSRGVVYIKYRNTFSGETGSKKLSFSVDAGQKIKREQSIEIRHCGGLEVTVKKIKIYDYLGIFCSKIRVSKKMETVVVLPPLEEIFLKEERYNSESMDSCDRYSPYKKGDDSSEIFDVRDFKEGDKLQQIHWKLSMKKSSLMVKEYGLPLAKETNMFIDFFVRRSERHPLRKMDLLIQGVYSYTMILLENSVPTQLIWYDNVEGMIKMMIVSSEEELMWTFREMFQGRMTHDDEEFVAAYVNWGLGKPMETGLYMTVSDGSKVSGESVGVRYLDIIRLGEPKRGNADGQ